MTATGVVTEKACTRCGKVKPLGAFVVHPKGKYKRQSWCRDCQSEYRNEVRSTTNYRYERAHNKARHRAVMALIDAHRDEFKALMDAEMRAEGLR